MLLVDGDQAHLAHVGDCRIYLFRDGRLSRLTRDHTVVQQEIDAGRLTPELARLVPHKHILTQSVATTARSSPTPPPGRSSRATSSSCARTG